MKSVSNVRPLPVRCSFCGKPSTKVEHVFTAKRVAICSGCVTLAHGLMQKYRGAFKGQISKKEESDAV